MFLNELMLIGDMLIELMLINDMLIELMLINDMLIKMMLINDMLIEMMPNEMKMMVNEMKMMVNEMMPNEMSPDENHVLISNKCVQLKALFYLLANYHVLKSRER